MSKRQHVLQLLSEAGPRGVTTGEFLEAGCGSRFGARVQELRDAGFVVDSRRLRAGAHVYTLQAVPRAAATSDVAVAEPLQLFEAVAPKPLNALLDWDMEAA
jgi:hypothetical protein